MSHTEQPENGVVVVGVDGSEPSREALRFAAEEARRRRARLRVVAAYDTSNDAFLIAYGGPTTLSDSRRASTRELAGQLVTETLGDDTDSDVSVAVRQGSAAGVLLEESADADLLVVGSRGHGGLRGLTLGSVSQQCVQHAPCPVTVVHAAPHVAHRARRPHERFEIESPGPLF